jgi:hypothetical protein
MDLEWTPRSSSNSIDTVHYRKAYEEYKSVHTINSTPSKSTLKTQTRSLFSIFKTPA